MTGVCWSKPCKEEVRTAVAPYDLCSPPLFTSPSSLKSWKRKSFSLSVQRFHRIISYRTLHGKVFHSLLQHFIYFWPKTQACSLPIICTSLCLTNTSSIQELLKEQQLQTISVTSASANTHTITHTHIKTSAIPQAKHQHCICISNKHTTLNYLHPLKLSQSTRRTHARIHTILIGDTHIPEQPLQCKPPCRPTSSPSRIPTTTSGQPPPQMAQSPMLRAWSITARSCRTRWRKRSKSTHTHLPFQWHVADWHSHSVGDATPPPLQNTSALQDLGRWHPTNIARLQEQEDLHLPIGQHHEPLHSQAQRSAQQAGRQVSKPP